MSLKRKIAIFSLAFFLSACAPSSLERSLLQAETPRSSSDLISLCSSADADKLAYCEGYIDSATHIWKYSTACASQAQSDQSFCAGANTAQEKIHEVFQACRDCDLNKFRPELKDSHNHVQLFMERMQKFKDELKATMGVCTPDEQRDEHYCSGYNTEVASKIAELSVSYSNGVSESARDLGLGDAASDVGLHLFASEDFYEFRPCLQTMISLQQVRNILLEFVHDNPEQLRDSTAIVTLAKALFYGLCPGPAQRLKPHMEQCTTWGYDGGQFGTKNTCDEAVVIQFMAKYQPAMKRQLNPGEAFRSGLSRSQIGRGWWMFTTCPVGHVSSVPFMQENRGVIGASRYSCVSK